jgi:hypothetical protein
MLWTFILRSVLRRSYDARISKEARPERSAETLALSPYIALLQPCLDVGRKQNCPQSDMEAWCYGSVSEDVQPTDDNVGSRIALWHGN